MNVVIIGGGSDAGGWIWDGKKFKKVPGWNPEAIVELGNALTIVQAAAHLKTPGLAEAATRGLADFMEKELAPYTKDGGVVVFR